MRSRSCSHVFLACWDRIIARACVLSSIAGAQVIGRRRCCYTARHVCVVVEGHRGGRSHSRSRSCSEDCARLARWGESTTSGSRRSFSRCRLRRGRSSLAPVRFRLDRFGRVFGGCRGVRGLRERTSACSPARLFCSLGVAAFFGRVVVCACEWLSLARARAVGLASGSCRAVFRGGTWGCRGLVARARVLALLVGAFFLVWSIVGHYCCCVRTPTPTARHCSCCPVGATSVLSCYASRARACTCASTAVWMWDVHAGRCVVP